MRVAQILKSARLPILNEVGPIKQNEVAVNSLKNKFWNLFADKFEGQRGIGLKGIEYCLKQVVPDINLKVTYGNPGLKYIHTLNGKVKGYKIQLPFDEIHKGDNHYIEILGHEVLGHFFKVITESKYVTHFETSLPKKKKLSQYAFYSDKFHCHEKDNLFDKDRMVKLIDEFFSKNKFSPVERIETLQTWRYNLKDELDACKAGFLSMLKNAFKLPEKLEDILPKLDSGGYPNIKEASVRYLAPMCFEDKIKILEEMIRSARPKKIKSEDTNLSLKI